MKLRSFCSVPVVMAVAGCVSLADRPTPAALSELTSTGKLRVGVATAPTQSAFFVVKDVNGQPRGVTVDLGKELARRLGVPVEFMVAPSSGELVNALSAGALDVSFMPVDDERKTKVNFGSDYFVMESTYLVRPGSDIKNLAEVDRANVRVVGIANTATIRSAGRSLTSTTIAPAKSVDEAMELLRSAKVDAFALTRDSLPLLAARLPGSRIVDGSFLQTGIAIAVPKNRPNALAYATAFMENAKASGIVRRALDDAGFKELAVAPASPGR